jgi:hypothetical protein
MAVTTKIPPERLKAYFDEFTRRFLRDGSPEAAQVEVVAPDLGDQHEANLLRIEGIVYDPHTNALEFHFEHGDHRVYRPREVWTVEEPNGFVSSIEIVRNDGVREIVTLHHVGLRRVG